MESGTEQRCHQYAWEPVKALKNKREGMVPDGLLRNISGKR